MGNLLQAFKVDPSDTNARKLVKYLDKHPMASCFIMGADVEIVVAARRMAKVAA